ncbi:MAG: DNA-directed RNA polymerase subunit beta' [Candidatus Omnitrophota bacterium]|nr:MAG: DNA-directed RNA polymerase subunit beta' [Candidatus Omnitrophota bacterium]
MSTQFDSISIGIASPEQIRSWSRGEVKKPETINYRTFKPEKDGLFCERIFGPVKDWECSCGKYKGIKHKGVVCDRCGVEVTYSRVRRERMGHIELAAPVCHVWFFKIVPSAIGSLLEMSVQDLEKVLYYEKYIVIDPGKSPFKMKQLLDEKEYQEALEKNLEFTAKIGAEAIKELLAKVDLTKMATRLRNRLKTLMKSEGANKERRGYKTYMSRNKILSTLKIVEAFRNSGNKPEWMILEVLPVIPPDLRPLVALEGGRFATSDLNDLYRRVINRNNRLKRLIELSAPSIIIHNEKRMLQEAVDALLDNGRHGRTIMANNRPLKSLSDTLRGKQGRFRQNLLGKRVDYSGRAVIVVGPELKLHQCSIPKKMALELFKPFIIKKLRERDFVHTIKGARRMVENVKQEVWDILEEIIKEHPVLLNRAPTLHRLGIQAFQPLLTEGDSIRIHPLVCTAFNADFDGDQMAIHVPLSIEAQAESRLLMLSVNNILSPANGKPIAVPSQDIALGCYYLTKARSQDKDQERIPIFSSKEEVITAFQDERVDLHSWIKVALEKEGEKRAEIITTTVGRVLFNQILPQGFRFVNEVVDKSKLKEIISVCLRKFGHQQTVVLLDHLKEIGFEYATLGGVSIAIDDVKIPPQKKEYIKKTKKKIEEINNQYQKGLITEGERHNKLIDIWTRTSDEVADLTFNGLGEFNPLFMMADSGARGSKQQIRQLGGMRGLMAKPSGEIIENPIIANFREGLTVLEYFISTHGGRKGLADTALKTADAGYLTRRLIDVAQDVIITEEDCGTLNGIFVSAIIEGNKVITSLKERIVGRVALDRIVNVINDKVIVEANQEIDEDMAEEIEKIGIERIRIRSVLTCETRRGVCAKCYGRNLATGRPVEVGEAIGIIAAQSIGEPGTQLTLRTFHIGGTASRVVEKSFIKAKQKGVVRYHSLKTAINRKGKLIALNRSGQISIHDKEGREIEKFVIPLGAIVVPENKEVEKGEVIAKWDPYNLPILTEVKGRVRFEDIKKDLSMYEIKNPSTGVIERVIADYKREDLHPQIIIQNEKKEILAFYPLPPQAHITVEDGQLVEAGDLLAKIPRGVSKTKDITGGLPRVAELFEARRPKDPAIISEIDGVVELEESVQGERKIIITSPSGTKKEYIIPHGKRLNVYRGDYVSAGQQLTDGPIVLQDILRVSGFKKLQEYLVNEIQEVYRLQGVEINDKHIEVIIRQMLRKVRIEDPGDTKFLVGSQVDRFEFEEENRRMREKNKKPAQASMVLLGITRSSLSTESFISAASFQETTRILTETAISRKRDDLLGLKENVIMGHLIPAGAGFKKSKILSDIHKQE